MKQTISKYWPVALSLFFFMSAAMFWAKPFMAALNYHEQYQLFLSTSDYFLERVAVPGGLMDYVSEWLIQFYRYTFIGASILAFTLLGLQVLTWLVARQLGGQLSHYPLTFLPSIFLWAYMGDENVMLSFGLSLLCAITLIVAYLHIRKPSLRLVSLLIMTPVSYWLIGPSVLVTMLFVAVHETMQRRTLGSAAVGLGLLLYLSFIVLACSYVVAYPLERLFWGIGYYRYPVYNPAMQLTTMLLTIFVPLLVGRLPNPKTPLLAVPEMAMLAIGGFFWVRASFQPSTYELIDYDFLLRTEQWDKIVEKAERQQASTPMSVCIVNLALSERDELADRLFEFYQNGGEGLLPSFVRNMISPIAPAEVFYRLGMINEASRYMFEAQEAIPNYRKSGRLTQRIIDCEIVNANYAVARKQLHLLLKAPMYRRWAEKRLALLGNEHAINADPIYGRLRRLRQMKQDFLYSDQEIDQMLGLLFMQNKENKMAYEYLVCYDLLQRDMDHFMQYYSLGRYIDYDHIPRPFQEILIGRWIQSHGSLQGLPYSVDQMTVEHTLDFIRTYSTNKNDPRLSQLPLCTNAWNYMLRGAKAPERKDNKQTIY